MQDVIVIGGGITGCAVLRELSKYNLDCLLLEKEEDVAVSCTKANSGIVHAGYDPLPNTKKAQFNLLGNLMYKDLACELSVPFEQCGSLVLAGGEGLPLLKELLERGEKNGVKRLKILSREEITKLEPNIADGISYALYAPTAGIVSPYEMAIALAEQAVINGAKVKLNAQVIDILPAPWGYTVITADGEKYHCKYLVNAAGYCASKINEMAGGREIPYSFVRGEYFILDTLERKYFNHTCFPLPDNRGKGVLVSPTAEGNVIVGPSSLPAEKGDDDAVKKEGLDYIKSGVSRVMKNVNLSKAIRVFSGVRAVSGDDFVIEREGNLITLAGICSPGLTAAPAIALYAVEELLADAGLKLAKKETFLPRPRKIITKELSEKELKEIIKQNPAYSKMVCRCEKITEGEIIDALNSPLKPLSLDALKRRVRAGMGRCQGGFCTPRVMEIISRHAQIPFDKVTKKGGQSTVIVSSVKEGKND